MEKEEGIITAQAMVFLGPELGFEPRDNLLPLPREGEVLVRNILASICSSDLHTRFGRRNSPIPSVLGHEVIGEIIALPNQPILDFNNNVLKVGDRITWAVYANDLSERNFQYQYPQKANNLFKYGHMEAKDIKTTFSGGFATHTFLQKGSYLYKIPTLLSDKVAVPLNCTHATVYGAIRVAGSIKDKRVMVSGCGMLGLSACSMAAEGGAKEVIAIDTNNKRLHKALDFGASQLITKEGIQSTLKQVDVLIETSGVPEAIEQGVAHLNIGGIAVLIGSVFKQRNLNINAENIVRNLLTLKGLHNYHLEDLAGAIQFVYNHRNKYPFEELVGNCLELTQIKAAFEIADTGDFYRVGLLTQ